MAETISRDSEELPAVSPPNISLQRTGARAPAAELGSLGVLKAVAAGLFVGGFAAVSCRAAEKPSTWRFARWGMSQEQVTKAGRGSAVVAEKSDQPSGRAQDAAVLLKGPITWDGRRFTAFYEFGRKTRRLESITLQLEARDQASADNLKADLTQLYGPPESGAKHEDVEVLSWTAAGEQVGFMRLTNPATAVGAPVTSVNFQPLEISR